MPMESWKGWVWGSLKLFHSQVNLCMNHWSFFCFVSHCTDMSTLLLPEHKLFIGMLPKNVTDTEMTDLFSQYGNIKDLQILRGSQQTSKGKYFLWEQLIFVWLETSMTLLLDLFAHLAAYQPWMLQLAAPFWSMKLKSRLWQLLKL